MNTMLESCRFDERKRQGYMLLYGVGRHARFLPRTRHGDTQGRQVAQGRPKRVPYVIKIDARQSVEWRRQQLQQL